MSANTFQVNLLAPEGARLRYHAGQYLQLLLSLNGNGQPKTLSYSIANCVDPDHPRHLQLFIQNSSALTEIILDHLVDLYRRNKSVKVILPMGKAYLQTRLDLPHFLIAAGSGISKIKCIAEGLVKRHPDALVNIYWSNKHIEDFYLLDKFQSWTEAYKGIKFTPILESPDDNWFGRSGFIYEVIESDFNQLENARFYLCGSPQMVYGTIDKLKARGLKQQNCYSDVFEYAPRVQKAVV